MAREFPIALTKAEVNTLLSWSTVYSWEAGWDEHDDVLHEKLKRFFDSIEQVDYEEREPSDDEIYNGYGREGGIPYDTSDEPGSLGENDWRL